FTPIFAVGRNRCAVEVAGDIFRKRPNVLIAEGASGRGGLVADGAKRARERRAGGAAADRELDGELKQPSEREDVAAFVEIGRAARSLLGRHETGRSHNQTVLAVAARRHIAAGTSLAGRALPGRPR